MEEKTCAANASETPPKAKITLAGTKNAFFQVKYT
jgi:hypothetical protein